MLDDARDLQIEALLELCHGAANYALATRLKGAKAIDGVFGIPVVSPTVLEKMPGLQPPFLCVYRSSEHVLQATMNRVETEATFYLDYVPPVADREEAESRWPLMRLVWRACSDAILLGRSPVVAGDQKILTLAGFRYADPNSFRVNYNDSEFPGNQVLQWFRGQFVAIHREPDCKPARLVPLLSLDVLYHIPGAVDPAVDPIVEEIIEAPDSL
jgi:hypothetical protein